MNGKRSLQDESAPRTGKAAADRLAFGTRRASSHADVKHSHLRPVILVLIIESRQT